MGGAASSGVLKDYSVQEKDLAVGGPYLGGWKVHLAAGTLDASLRATVWRAAKSDVGADAFQVLQRGVARLRATRHPHVLKFVDSSESEEALVLVTEPVVPLHVWLAQGPGAFGGGGEEAGEGEAWWSNRGWLAWGVESLVTAVAFVGEASGGCYGSLCAGSVFVTPAGAWKLGMLEYSFSAAGAEEGRRVWSAAGARDGGGRLGDAWQSPERREDALRALERASPHAQDSWGLGCVLVCVGEGSGEKGLDELRADGLRKAVSLRPPWYGSLVGRLLSSNPAARPPPSHVLTALQPWLAQYPTQRTLKFLEDLPLHDAAEKKAFFDALPSQLPSIPLVTRHGHVLPLLMHAIEFGAAGGGGTAALAPILDIGATLPRARYESQVLPCVVRLFASRDRATRMQLLHHLESFVASITARDMHEQIWPRIREGFGDAEPLLRIATLKAVLPLCKHLASGDRSLAVRHVASLLARDPEAGLRVNAALCLARLAPLLTPASERARLVDPLVASAVRDPFAPVRRACFQALGRLFTMGLRPFVPPPEPSEPAAAPAAAAAPATAPASASASASWVVASGMELLASAAAVKVVGDAGDSAAAAAAAASTTTSTVPDEAWGLEAGNATVSIIAACGQGAMDPDPHVRSIALSVLLAAHTAMCTWSAQKATYDEAKIAAAAATAAAPQKKKAAAAGVVSAPAATAQVHSDPPAPRQPVHDAGIPAAQPTRSGMALRGMAPVAASGVGVTAVASSASSGWDVDGDGWGDFGGDSHVPPAQGDLSALVGGAMSDIPVATPRGDLDGWSIAADDDVFAPAAAQRPAPATVTAAALTPHPATVPRAGTTAPSTAADAALGGGGGGGGAAAARARMEERRRARQAEKDKSAAAPATHDPPAKSQEGEGWGFNEDW
jgi:hypothetical protein